MGRPAAEVITQVGSGDDDGVAGGRAWRKAEFDRVVDFAVGSRDDRGGFGWLDVDGAIDPAGPRPLWITCRMAHVFALAALRGRPDAPDLLGHGITALRTTFADTGPGGFFETAGEPDAAKTAYGHAFVVLAGASAVLAGVDAIDVLDAGLGVVDARFWSDGDGLVRESFSRDWTRAEAYRGANSNMHMTEAFLAAADALDLAGRPDGDLWRARAGRITDRIVHGFARDNDWRIPEHFDERWRAQPDFNRETPDHPFRPYGATVGHALEWARLATQQAGPGRGHEWLVHDAVALFDRAVADGWAPDGAPGFVYTTDWEGRPVVRDRMHWVVAEATATAAALHRVTGEARYADQARQWWSYIDQYVRDLDRGSWHHQLDPANHPVQTVWAGKPDAYHAAQACLLPDLPTNVSVAEGIRQT